MRVIFALSRHAHFPAPPPPPSPPKKERWKKKEEYDGNYQWTYFKQQHVHVTIPYLYSLQIIQCVCNQTILVITNLYVHQRLKKTNNVFKRSPKVCKYICIGKCVSKLIAHPHELVWVTNEWFLLALVTSNGHH